MSTEPFHPLIAGLIAEIVYPDEASEAYLPQATVERMRDEITNRHTAEPSLCVHLVYAFIRCHERGLTTLGRQLLALAKHGLSQSSIEDVIHNRRTGQTRQSLLPSQNLSHGVVMKRPS